MQKKCSSTMLNETGVKGNLKYSLPTVLKNAVIHPRYQLKYRPSVLQRFPPEP